MGSTVSTSYNFLLRFLTLAVVVLSLGHSNRVGAQQSQTAQASESFELGGQILAFLSSDQMHEANMDWVKMQISYKPGGSLADAQFVINHARHHGFKVLLSVVGYKHELAANPNQYYKDYADFLADVAQLDPDAIEVWNEPNIDFEWPAGLINGANYTQMLKRAYPAIKAANPDVMVISAAPAPTGFFGGGCSYNGCDDKPFIEQMAGAGAASYFDCTGMHYNEGIVPPSWSSGDPRGYSSHYSRYYPAMVDLYRSVFPGKPVCFTELGYLSPDGLGGLPAGLEWANGTSAEEQANWLAEAARLSRDSDFVRLMIVWNVDAEFVSSNVFAGWAIIRQGGQCLSCSTLSSVLSAPPFDKPTLLTPEHKSVTNDTTPQLTWQSISQADEYQLQIDDNSDFSSPERDVTLTATTYTVSSALPEGRFFWRVRGRNDDGAGPWSDRKRFEVDTQPPDVPTDFAPESGGSLTGSYPTLSWGANDDAAHYEIRVDLLNPPGGEIASAAENRYTPNQPLIPGVHYWQVRAYDVAGNASAWSAVSMFSLESSDDAAPELGYHTENTVTLSWNRVSWADAYRIHIARTPDFELPYVHNQKVFADQLEITTPPLENGVYYWRVRARFPDRTWGEWSETGVFRVGVTP